ncbi:MICOS complex subunit Mic10-like [Centruroides vittatus]|uniref:MICOS complex subunit Mic10-like n=1 Tax=Centruroides vittatus TaxID=120091 RepID=UPI00350F89F6
MSEMGKRSEDEHGEKWDRCVADMLLKMGAGLGVGAIFSLALFKRRWWPVTFGWGTGFGMALSNCQHDLNESYLYRIQKIKEKQKSIKEASPT